MSADIQQMQFNKNATHGRVRCEFHRTDASSSAMQRAREYSRPGVEYACSRSVPGGHSFPSFAICVHTVRSLLTSSPWAIIMLSAGAAGVQCAIPQIPRKAQGCVGFGAASGILRPATLSRSKGREASSASDDEEAHRTKQCRLG